MLGVVWPDIAVQKTCSWQSRMACRQEWEVSPIGVVNALGPCYVADLLSAVSHGLFLARYRQSWMDGGCVKNRSVGVGWAIWMMCCCNPNGMKGFVQATLSRRLSRQARTV